MIYKLYHN